MTGHEDKPSVSGKSGDSKLGKSQVKIGIRAMAGIITRFNIKNYVSYPVLSF